MQATGTEKRELFSGFGFSKKQTTKPPFKTAGKKIFLKHRKPAGWKTYFARFSRSFN
jgi:hypothetical protein